MDAVVESILNIEQNLDSKLKNLSGRQKIVTLEVMGELLKQFMKDKTIVQCHGVFDLLHVGHIKHLNHAKTFGDILIVTVTADKYVNKGPGRPCFTQTLRAEALAALTCVDYVIVNEYPTAVEAIKILCPSFYVKGIEYQNINNDITGKISEEEEAVKSAGGMLKFTDDIVFSSSSLLNQFYSPFSKEVLTFLQDFKTRYQSIDILQYIDQAKNLNVLLIGEAIIDIYHYGEVIGKSGKEPVLVAKYHREEIYTGGVLAVANHLSSFCAKVTCITMIGEDANYEEFIRERMKENVEVIFHYKKDAPTLVKRRYLEEYTSQKLFEIYEIEDSYFEGKQQREFLNSVNQHINKHDLVIVTDYGH